MREMLVGHSVVVEKSLKGDHGRGMVEMEAGRGTVAEGTVSFPEPF